MPKKDNPRKNPDKNLISEEDQLIFAEAMKKVKPLTPRKAGLNHAKQGKENKLDSPSRQQNITPDPITPTNIALKKLRELKFKNLKQSTFTEAPFIRLDQENICEVSGSETILFHRPGLTNREFSKLTRGRFPIQATLDLHQLSVNEALKKCQQFIDSCQHQNKNSLLIIHGKGRKEHKPILKNILNAWLRNHPSVLGFHSAKPYHGGSGALYLLLRNKARDSR